MAFIVKKNIHDKEYYYLNENKRVGRKVKTKTLAYLGKNKKEAEKKAKEFLFRRKADEKQESKRKIIEESKDEQKNISTEISIEELAAFCKRKGFVYPSGEIYGGLAGFW